MRIGVISLGRRGSGGPIALELSRALAGSAAVFALLSENAEILPLWRESGLQHIIVPVYRNLAGALLSYLDPFLFRRLASLVRAQQPDVLLYPMFHTWNPFLQQRLREIPAVVAVHDPIPHPGLADFFYRLLQDRAIRQASRCLIFSQAFVGSLSQRGVPSSHLDVIPHGPLFYPRGPVPAPPPSTSAPLRFLFFGRLTPYKGLDVLLRAYALVRQQRPVSLLIVGSGDLKPYARLLRGLPEVQVVNAWVPDSELDPYFSTSDVVVLPYTSATQSGVIPLAAAYGLPVVATRVGGIPEQVQDGASGLLVAPGSVDDLARALLRLVDDPALRLRLGEGLKRLHLEERSWSSIAARVLASCERALAGDPPTSPLVPSG